jgi:flagellin
MSTNVTLTSSISKSLYSLQSTEKLMDTTSYNLTTGKKVNSALDDPIAYFAAQDHTQKASDLQVLKDAMGEGIETINAASTGIDSIIDLIDSAISLAKSALSDSDESSTYAGQYEDILAQIDDLAGDSGYGGINLLGGTDEELTITFNEEGDSALTISGFDATASTGYSLAGATNSWATSADINGDIDDLNAMKSDLRAQAKTLSSQLNIVTARQDFTATMINTLTEGAGNLVNANTTEEGVKLTTLQTQQSLAVKSLSIASSASQAVLALFS